MPRFRDRNLDPASSMVMRPLVIPFISAVSQTSKCLFLQQFSRPMKIDRAGIYASGVTATIAAQGYIVKGDQTIAIASLAIDAVPEKFQIGLTRALITGVVIEKGAATAIAFSAAYTVNTAAAAGKPWGAFLVQMDNAGTVSTKAFAADQSFASEALALASVPAPDANKVALGYITVQGKEATKWTAQTDDMTGASDVNAANFYKAGAAKGPDAANPVFDITPVALKNVVEDVQTAHVIRANEYLCILYTSNGTGALVNASVTLETAPWPLADDARDEDE